MMSDPLTQFVFAVSFLEPSPGIRAFTPVFAGYGERAQK
jgi:hypothetical protein